MQLTYTQEQKEQVWRALGWEPYEHKFIPGCAGGVSSTDDPYRTATLWKKGGRSIPPKPEDVLWQLRALAIEKDAGEFTETLAGLVFRLSPITANDHWTRERTAICATPQQIFDAALAVLNDAMASGGKE